MAAAIAVLAEVEALPGSQQQPPIPDRHAERAAHKRRLEVSRAVVGPFKRVHIRQRFRHNAVQCHLEVDRYVGVGVLVD